MEKQLKSGFVTLIGRPNVGKSTLMNHLIGQKIAITSNKPQTTRNRVQTVYTDERGQIIFVDTPGIHKAKNKLQEYMSEVVDKALEGVDVILWLVEPEKYIGPRDKEIAERLSALKQPVILIINKADTVPKERIGEVISAYREVGHFDDIVALCALRGTNVDMVLSSIYKLLPYGPMYYDEDTVTRQPVRDIAGEIIREKALRCLNDEVPHGIAVEIIKFHERDNGLVDIDANIICERESHKGIIIGRGGSMLKKIGTQARKDIEELVDGQVNLKLFVKVRKDWRDNQMLLKSLGYDKKDIYEGNS
ncbi:MAG: GTPase Era [Lachnospiraceae bacterium]|nr:GTPase Era [Lachnospiraceae bacterium]